MKKKIKISDSLPGKLYIEYLKDTIHFVVDEESCKFLIELFTDFLNDKEVNFVDYDPDTGYDCGLFERKSLGLMVSWRDISRWNNGQGDSGSNK